MTDDEREPTGMPEELAFVYRSRVVPDADDADEEWLLSKTSFSNRKKKLLPDDVSRVKPFRKFLNYHHDTLS